MWTLGHLFIGFFVDKVFTIFNAVVMVLDKSLFVFYEIAVDCMLLQLSTEGVLPEIVIERTLAAIDVPVVSYREVLSEKGQSQEGLQSMIKDESETAKIHVGLVSYMDPKHSLNKMCFASN